MTRILRAAIGAAVLGLALAGPGGWNAARAASPDTTFDGSKARVNQANKLRTLTQLVGSAGCRLAAGIETERALDDLGRARLEINAILDGLEHGGQAMGVPTAERHSVVRRSLGAVREIWAPVDSAAAKVLAGFGDVPGTVKMISETNGAFLEAAIILASDVSGKYSNPNELTQADAMALNIAGRQRMLITRIGKEVCGIATGNAEFGSPERLAETVGLFDVSLKALREGMPDAGINPPPNGAIRDELAAIHGQWAEVMPVLRDYGAGTMPGHERVSGIAVLASEVMRDMDNVVTLYMLSTPGQDDVYRVPLLAYAEEELATWLTDPMLVAAIREQNAAHRGLAQADIDALDQTWRAEAKGEGGPLIEDLLGRQVSEWLRGKQAGTASFVTEVFAMDNRGLNVAQNVVTSDYWQGDEAKWQETIGNGSGLVHISEVEFDESTGFYQAQVSMPVRDPATGVLIGAVTFGINVQSLL